MSTAAPKQSAPTLRSDALLKDAEACALMYDRGIWTASQCFDAMKARHDYLPFGQLPVGWQAPDAAPIGLQADESQEDDE